ncbi:hypothetical protein KR054_009359, partial [Drosophila jambulina]
MVTRTHNVRMAGIGDSVTKVRKTAKGELLLELKKSPGASIRGIKEKIGSVLGSSLPIRTVSPQTTFVIRDQDELVTREELLAALATQGNLSPSSVNVKAVRSLPSGGQVATFSVPEAKVGALSSLGRVKVGWTRCHLRAIESQSPWSCGSAPKRWTDVLPKRGFVRAKTGGWWIYSVYLAPNLSLSEFGGAIDRLAADARGRVPAMIVGDFNAWAVEWGSSLTNARDRSLLEAFSSLDVTLLNLGDKPTFSKAGASSVVDLSFVSRSRASQCSWTLSE